MLLDQKGNCLELRMRRSLHQHKDQTLCRRQKCACIFHPTQSHRTVMCFLGRDAVHKNVHGVTLLQQVQGGLLHADVGLDPEQDHGLALRLTLHLRLQLVGKHTEQLLLKGRDAVVNGGSLQLGDLIDCICEAQLSTCVSCTS